MKKLIALFLLSAFCIFTLTACNGNNGHTDGGQCGIVEPDCN